MANIPLKSIKFPGLDDTYTVPQVDNTLTVAGAAADAKKTGDEIGAIKNDLSEFPNGTYPNMTVGNADQCKARENSSMANCVHHWMETMQKAVDESKQMPKKE